MNDISRISRNFAYLLAGGIAASLVEFAAEVILARHLSDTGYGYWSYAQSVFVYLILFADLGLTVYGAREIARYKEKLPFFMANIIGMRMISALVISIGLFTVIQFLHISTELKLLYGGGSLVMFALAFDPVFVFQGLERMAGIALWRVLNFTFFLIGVLIFTLFDPGIAVVSWVRGASFLFAAIPLWFWISKKIGVPAKSLISPAQWRPILLVSIVIALSTLIINVYFTFDTLVLGWFRGAEEVGWYAAAYRFSCQFMGLAMIFQVVFGPVISRYRDDREQLNKTIQNLQLVLLLLGSLVSAGMFLLAGPLVNKLFGPDFHHSIWILQGQSLVLLLFFLQTGYITVLLYGGKERLYFICMTVGAALNLLLNIAFIPHWGYRGAVIVTGISYLIILILAAFYTNRVFKFKRYITGRAVILVAGTVLLTLLLSRSKHEIIATSMFVMIYIIAVYFMFGKHLLQLIGEIRFGE